MTDAEAQSSETQHAEEVELLRRVLDPLGSERVDELIELIADYLEDVSPITWCAGQTEPGESESAVVWELGKSSPLDSSRTVFAMFIDETVVVAFSFAAVAVEGHDGALAGYFRETIFRPRYATGPVSLQALYNDLRFYLEPEKDEPQPPKKRTNGA